MPDIRVRGEDVTIRLTQDGKEVLELSRIENFSATLRMDILEAEFLGQVGVSVDNIVKGAEGTLSLQYSDAGVFDFVSVLAEAASRRIAIPTVNIQALIVFPDGSARAQLFADVVFGNVPMNFSGRAAYGTVGLSFRCGQVPSFPVV